MKKISTLLLAACAALSVPHHSAAQGLPEQIRISDDGRRLVTGGLPSEGLYDEAVVQVIELWFDQSNYWQLLTSNYQSSTDLPATMAVNGDTLDSPVGVRFKGQTSYQQTQNSQKKSFNITIDHEDPAQDVDGYQTLNLNNCFQDPSFLREVTYLHLNRRHIPAAKGSYVQLFINGENWGLYPSVQALNGDYLKEWFLTNNGTRWRALRNDITGGPGGGGGPGAIFGTGVSSLNWLGTDTSEYAKKYTLKKTHKPDPWTDLVKVCDVLNNTPLAELEDSIKIYLDLDRTLWFLAQEIAFSDDDSYVHKGGMDYYLYWEPETGRLTPLEYDGNSVMRMQEVDWSPFYNEDDDRFALMNRLFAVPEIRQRYLAHLRTIIAQSMEQASFDSRVDTYFELVDSFVQADTKKLYTYNQFVQGKQDLKNFLQQRRRDILLANDEVDAEGLEISEVEFASGGELFAAPDAGEEVAVTAQVSGAAGVEKVTLYFATGFVGVFQKTEMFDDGAHGDGAAGDGVFGAVIPGFGNGTYVRHYVEAIAANAPKTASYAPAGAEHDVFIYRVGITEYVDSEVVVNELMASNTATAADQDGEFDDWIELFNNSADAVDLSGWSLTDNDGDLSKWTFPEGSILGGGGYLIVWADEDGSQAGLHASFKLSASGEKLWLADPEQRIAQEITFGEQLTDKGFARVPNGTGNFVIQNPTFNWNNELPLAAGAAEAAAVFEIFPNPAGGKVAVRSALGRPARLEVFSLLGQKVWETSILEAAELNVEDWQPGVFLVKIEDGVRKLVVR